MLYGCVRQFSEGNRGIHGVLGTQIVRREATRRKIAEAPPKLGELRERQGKASGLLVTSKFTEQVRHAFKGLEEMKRGNAAARSGQVEFVFTSILRIA